LEGVHGAAVAEEDGGRGPGLPGVGGGRLRGRHRVLRGALERRWATRGSMNEPSYHATPLPLCHRDAVFPRRVTLCPRASSVPSRYDACPLGSLTGRASALSFSPSDRHVLPFAPPRAAP